LASTILSHPAIGEVERVNVILLGRDEAANPVAGSKDMSFLFERTRIDFTARKDPRGLTDLGGLVTLLA
jgi:hypothetical protein